MTKEVMVTIFGLQMSEEESIEVVHVGEYYERNGSRYVLFDELYEGIAVPIKNVIKIREDRLEVRKSGPVTVNMIFEEGKSQRGTYAVPFGSFLVEIFTTSVHLEESEERLEATASYMLEINGARYADCDVTVTIESRKNYKL